jgi:hypothetical protein
MIRAIEIQSAEAELKWRVLVRGTLNSALPPPLADGHMSLGDHSTEIVCPKQHGVPKCREPWIDVIDMNLRDILI